MMRHRKGQAVIKEEEGHRELIDIEGNYFYIRGVVTHLPM
jgi:hypothetical protein